MKICITGGISSGKSTVMTYIRDLGYTTIEMDKIAKNIISTNLEVKCDIIKYFGQESFDINGNYNTNYMSDIVFNHKSKLKLLNSILFKHIYSFIIDLSYDIVFIEAPLVFEYGIEDMFDIIILVTIDDNKQLSRLIDRDGNDAIKRLNLQSQYKDKCDYIIDNSNDLSDTYSQIDNILKNNLEI